jgi:hypothetical protein
MIRIKLARQMTLVCSIWAVLPTALVQAATPSDLRVHFKLDERLTRPLHMGERLVSPDTFDTAVQEGTRLTVEAEARLFGRIVPATFTPERKSGVSVSRTKGNRVRITARGCDVAGSLTVTAQGLSRQLSINTSCEGDTIRAEISQ